MPNRPSPAVSANGLIQGKMGGQWENESPRDIKLDTDCKKTTTKKNTACQITRVIGCQN